MVNMADSDGSDWQAAIRRALKALAVREAKAAKGAGDIATDVWGVLERRGWVVAEADGAWRLSNAGRIHLKRLLSRGASGSLGPGAATASSGAQAGRIARGRRDAHVNLAESPLAWLRRRTDADGQPLISDAQFEAGERLRADFERGAMGPRVTANWSGAGSVNPGTAGPDRELELNAGAIAARERVRAALAAAGPELSGILIDVCCHLKGLAEVERAAGWPQRTAKVVLLMALSTLARHYGLVSREREGRGPVRHWGADGYRPG